MRLSLEAQKAVYAEETGDYPIILLTFEHPELPEQILLSTDPTTRLPGLTDEENVVYGTISNGLEYIFCPIEINLPTEDEESAPQTVMSVSNIGREMVETIRTLLSSPLLTMTIVLASDADRIEGQISGFKFTDVNIDQMTISGTLTMDIMTNEPFPYRTFGPSTASGLFKS